MSPAPTAGTLPEGMAPPPQAPPSPIWQVKMQADGTSVYYIPGAGENGDDLYLKVNDPPKPPKPLQQAA